MKQPYLLTLMLLILGLCGPLSPAEAAESSYLYSGAFTSIEDASLSGANHDIATGNLTGFSDTTSTLVMYDIATSVTGYGTVTCPPFVEHGLTGNCSVTPADSFTVVAISGCGGIWLGSSPYITGAITAPCSVTATFSDTTPPITSATPATGTYTASQSVTLACTDQGGSGCAATRYCRGTGCTPSTLYTAPIAIDTTTLLRFSSTDTSGNNEAVHEAGYTIIPYYNLAVTISGNGSVTSTPLTEINCPSSACNRSYITGTTITLVATAGADSYLSSLNGWSGCDVVSGNMCTVTMTAAKLVTATFTLLAAGSNYSFNGTFSGIEDVPLSGINHNITSGSMAGITSTSNTLLQYDIAADVVGSGFISCTQFVEHGSTGNCTVIPAENYVVQAVTGCNGTWSGTAPYITGIITAPCTVTATFAVIDATAPITTASSVGGTFATSQNIILSCSDTDGSGCAATYYCLGSGCAPTTLYTGPIVIADSQILRFYSVDNSGNGETIRQESYIITNQVAAVPALSLPVSLLLMVGLSGILMWPERKRKLDSKIQP